MGQRLSAPNVEKGNNSGGNELIKFAVSEMQGWRTTMEDSHASVMNFHNPEKDWAYFAVFDGHAGSLASEYCSKELHRLIINKFEELELNPSKISEDPEFNGLSDNLPSEIYNLAVATHEGFILLDEKMKNDPEYAQDPMSCGTTALALIVTPKYYIYANCGDSRGILCRDDKLFFKTKDHKPADIGERDRIIEAGGSVYMERVNGNLAVSRALGDYSFKTNAALPSIRQAVSPEPTITILERTATDQFAVLACDGVWDVMTSEQVSSFILNRLKATSDMCEIVNVLVDCCLYQDSKDNMTCMLIKFPGAPSIDEEMVEKDKELQIKIRDAIESMLPSEKDDISCYTVLKKLKTDNIASGEYDLYYKINFVIDLLDKAKPDRDKSKDYISPLEFRALPPSLSFIQAAASRYGIGSSAVNGEES